MSNVHVIHVNDAKGDLIDILYAHHGCVWFDSTGSWREWPAPEAIDYPVYCHKCGGRVAEVPLTEDGQREYGPLLNVVITGDDPGDGTPIGTCPGCQLPLLTGQAIIAGRHAEEAV